jgi:S-disulfanyl-L-cysteine oxidoreductase SoxD
MTLWPTPALVVIIIAFAGDVSAQTTAPKRPRTTRSGIYTTQQAKRGQDVYVGLCKSCHTPETHTGAVFATKWNGKALSELYGYISEQMPKNEPGSLSPEEYADVMTYVLKLNGMPAGTKELPPDGDAMKSIRIDAKSVTTTKSSPPVRKDP